MTEQIIWHCAGCGSNYITEKEVEACSRAHAEQAYAERVAKEEALLRAKNGK